MKPLLVPGGILVAVAILLHTGLLSASVPVVVFAFYAALVAGLLLAWRFHSSRIFFALLVLFLAQHAVAYFSAGHLAGSASSRTVLAAVGLLLPVNFVILALQQERGFVLPRVAAATLALFVESVMVAVLCRPDALAATPHGLRHIAFPPPLPFATVLVSAAAAAVLLIRFLLFRKPVESGLFWAMAASLLAIRFGGVGRIPSAYFATAAFTVAVSIVETSYLLAYHDELTTLPSRRAFHEALLRLEAPYSIAMVDIDHFKKCNDTYGHDTGDQVLRLMASRLARVTGGGQAYRCGGEEFAVVFPGKNTHEVLEHLEQLRASIEASSFRLRGRDRRRDERGPERRNLRSATRSQGHLIRDLSRGGPVQISVTASMGVASSGTENSSAEDVIKAADKALYRAKEAGRNRIESDSIARRRARRKAASIA